MQIFTEFPVLVPAIAVLITEVGKLAIVFVHNHTITKRDIFQTGGMPSGHSALASSLIVTTMILRGANSLEFAIACVFGLVIVYDAMKLRRDAGYHATQLNIILKNNLLNERLGHTPYEVLVGIFLGSGISFLLLSL